MISLSRGNETPRRVAKADCVIPRGFRNSSSSISPGWVGGRCVGSRRRTKGFPLDPLVIVRDFDVVGIAVLPPKTDPVLVVDANAVLPCAVAAEALQPIAGRDTQLSQAADSIELRQLATGSRPKGPWTGPACPTTVDAF